MSKKILFIIDTLRSGGRERRFIELLHYLNEKPGYKMQVVVLTDEIHYDYIYDLNIEIIVLTRKWIKKDPFLFTRILKIARESAPDIIHSWGIMATIYAIPAKLALKRPLIASLISNAQMRFKYWSINNIFFRLSYYFSDKILSNSKAGLSAYGINSPKSHVVYNGVRLDRFNEEFDVLKIRNEIGIKTRFAVIMVASFLPGKDYDFFLDVAKKVDTLTSEVTFIAIGDGASFNNIKRRITTESITNILLLGQQKNVEKFVAVCDIGVLFTNTKYHSEGISNSILEYMALGKPVITTDILGGSSEIIENGKSGFIINKDIDKVSYKINRLINNEELRRSLGTNGKKIIESKFTIEQMGKAFERILHQLQKS